MVSSGTEATMSAIRVARGFTRRDRDRQVRRLLSRPRRQPARESGQRRHDARHPVLARRSGRLHSRHARPRIQRRPRSSKRRSPASRGQIACVILEPVVGNMGVVLPEHEFLEAIGELCRRHGALLIFDEVMTGFRLAYGGAQERLPRLREARPDHAWQDRRGRHAGRRLRRPGRRDGLRLARRSRLSGRHAFGQSAGHGLRDRHAQGAEADESLSADSKSETTRLARGLCDAAAAGRRAAHRRARWAACSRSSSIRKRS